jgi:hypothetical protein
MSARPPLYQRSSSSVEKAAYSSYINVIIPEKYLVKRLPIYIKVVHYSIFSGGSSVKFLIAYILERSFEGMVQESYM